MDSTRFVGRCPCPPAPSRGHYWRETTALHVRRMLRPRIGRGTKKTQQIKVQPHGSDGGGQWLPRQWWWLLLLLLLLRLRSYVTLHGIIDRPVSTAGPMVVRTDRHTHACLHPHERHAPRALHGCQLTFVAHQSIAVIRTGVWGTRVAAVTALAMPNAPERALDFRPDADAGTEELGSGAGGIAAAWRHGTTG